MKRTRGGITAPVGFMAAGVACGIKKGAKDLAIIASEKLCVAAATFTTNRVKAAPVQITRRRLRHRHGARAVVVNSGNANCSTGKRGLRDAVRMTELCAAASAIPPDEILVASTGPIGKHLPMENVEKGIKLAAASLRKSGFHAAAMAILTTDTVTKEIAVSETIAGSEIRIGAMAKGAGMIEPNMATMLAFITTDANIDAGCLDGCLRLAVQRSFNRITVDGDRSTNDMVIALANGLAGNRRIREGSGCNLFRQVLEFVCSELARMIVRDGEGATKFISVTVKGARSLRQAETAARAIANSNLVKTALYGENPNWGRIMAALGRSGATVRQDAVDIYLCGVQVTDGGEPAAFPRGKLSKALRKKEIEIVADLNIGKSEETVWTCDFSPEYVAINK
jgi:glutamate N-acetyltransferase/amino-acid N-acetyltransferase